MSKKHLIIGGPLAVAAAAAVYLGASQQAPAPMASGIGDEIIIANETDSSAQVWVSFGSDSTVKAEGWKSFCSVTAPLNCIFVLPAHGKQPAGHRGEYTNVTISYNTQGCGATKAELNVANPKWYNTLDVSLVDGYSNKLKITSREPSGQETVLGPPAGKEGNEKIVGVFPYGCDICTGREHPPCGIPAGGPGCHAGTQFKPEPVCQWQGPAMGPGNNSIITVALVN